MRVLFFFCQGKALFSIEEMHIIELVYIEGMHVLRYDIFI